MQCVLVVKKDGEGRKGAEMRIMSLMPIRRPSDIEQRGTISIEGDTLRAS
jgi:hypothetical protein